MGRRRVTAGTEGGFDKVTKRGIETMANIKNHVENSIPFNVYL